MPPGSLVTLAVVVPAVLPGAAYVWAFERQVSAYGVTLADRAFRFVAVSMLFHFGLA